MHIVVDVAMSCSQEVAKKQLAVLAHRAVQLYPNSLEDRINGSLVGTGYDSLLRQMIFRTENVNRSTSQKRKSNDPQQSTSAEVAGPPKKKKRDAYGCISFQPDMVVGMEDEVALEKQYLKDMFTNPDPEKWDNRRILKAIEVCFPEQRRIINGNIPIKEIQEEWPCLFECNAMMAHFNLLVGINLMKVFGETSCDKIQTVYEFLKSKGQSKTLFEEVDQLEAEKKTNNFRLQAVVLALMDYFEEDRRHLFHSVDVITSLLLCCLNLKMCLC